MTERVLLDAGPIVALVLETELHHKACIRYMEKNSARLLTCWPVLTEAAWLLQKRPDAFQGVLTALERGGFGLLSLTGEDVPKIATIWSRYRNLKLQLADATLIHLANRERIDTIFTLDRRDFSVVRGAHRKSFLLVP